MVYGHSIDQSGSLFAQSATLSAVIMKGKDKMNAKKIMEIVPEEIRNGYTFNRHGVCTSPGKFQGEFIATIYYYDMYLNGVGTIMEVSDDEREAFGLGENENFVYLYESNDGFVTCYYFPTREEAEENEEYDNMGEYYE